MEAVNYTDLRQHLKDHMDKVYQDHEPLIVTRKNNQNVVLMSLKGIHKAAHNGRELIEQFRLAENEVIHIKHINLGKKSPFFREGSPGANFGPGFDPHEGEKVFIKHYPNAFRETGLDEYLQCRKIRRLHIMGAMSNMCIDSTTRAAFDLRYSLIIHSKACAAKGYFGTNIIHRISMATLGSRFAKVV